MKALLFKDSKGIEYIYNDDSGMIFPCGNIFTNTDTSCNSCYPITYFKTFQKKLWECLDNYTYNKHVTVENSHKTSGFNELIFKMTSQCNMRCKYCLYSDHYPFTESYESELLSFENAKKATDIFMNHFKVIHSKVLSKAPTFAFYGGEPLMNFNVIEKTVNYINNKYGNMLPKFTITTNGLLLEQKGVADFLKKNNFAICVSIDGYPANHDRNRVGINGGPTFEKILKIVSDNFKDYPNIFSLCCIDTKTDLLELEHFISKNDRMNGGDFPHLLRISTINNEFTDYFNNFSPQDRQMFIGKYELLHKKFVEACKTDNPNWFLNLLFATSLYQIYDRSKIQRDYSLFSVQTGACVPGDKLYVLPDGKLSICEKVTAEEYIIGDCDDGLNYEAIKNILNKFNSFVNLHCKDCKISRLCGLCYASLHVDLNSGNYFVDDNTCANRIANVTRTLSDIVEIESYNPGFFERRLNKIINKNFTLKNEERSKYELMHSC